jgi:NADPH:quinone reductase-like Zn-dependent oxidoreductase
MNAIVINDFGDPSVLTLTTMNKPVPGPDEVLVNVKALSINPVDIKTRAGKGVAGRLRQQMPIILGWDISGTVVESNSDQFKAGDDVFGMIHFPGHGKAYAEYATAPAAHLALKPGNITHEEAAAATLAALTAWQVLAHRAKITAGSRVLIHGASGGVGHYAVQIARHLGAHVIGTSSAANKDFVMSLGANEHIDYRTVRFEDVARDIDVVLDTAGGETIVRSIEVVKPGGAIITIPTAVAADVVALAAAKNINCRFELVYSSGEDMQQLAQLMADGVLHSHLYRSFPFLEMPAAHALLEAGRTVGKIVLQINL